MLGGWCLLVADRLAEDSTFEILVKKVVSCHGFCCVGQHGPMFVDAITGHLMPKQLCFMSRLSPVLAVTYCQRTGSFEKCSGQNRLRDKAVVDSCFAFAFKVAGCERYGYSG